MRVLKLAFLATAVLLVVSKSAVAQGAGNGPVTTNCAADIKKFCVGKEHGSGEIRACLAAKKAELSAECKTTLETTGPGSGRRQ